MKKKQPSSYRHSVTFESSVETKDSDGIADITWSAIHTDIPCGIETLNGKELVKLGQVINTNIKKISVYTLTPLDESMRCLIGGIYYSIISILPDDELDLYLEITISKIKNV